jgi:hypothetical protein
MGTTSSKARVENQSKTTATTPVVHHTLTSTRRASINSTSGERRPSVTNEGRERRSSQISESSNLTRPTVASSAKMVDNTNRPRRASIPPRASTIKEESSTKMKARSGGSNIFNMCCGVDSTAP